MRLCEPLVHLHAQCQSCRRLSDPLRAARCCRCCPRPSPGAAHQASLSIRSAEVILTFWRLCFDWLSRPCRQSGTEGQAAALAAHKRIPQCVHASQIGDYLVLQGPNRIVCAGMDAQRHPPVLHVSHACLAHCLWWGLLLAELFPRGVTNHHAHTSLPLFRCCGSPNAFRKYCGADFRCQVSAADGRYLSITAAMN